VDSAGVLTNPISRASHPVVPGQISKCCNATRIRDELTPCSPILRTW
jgi:hypothetical protein